MSLGPEVRRILGELAGMPTPELSEEGRRRMAEARAEGLRLSRFLGLVPADSGVTLRVGRHDLHIVVPPKVRTLRVDELPAVIEVRIPTLKPTFLVTARCEDDQTIFLGSSWHAMKDLAWMGAIFWPVAISNGCVDRSGSRKFEIAE